MAATSTSENLLYFSLGLIIIFFFMYSPQGGNAHPIKACKFEQIYHMGDSISDNENPKEDVLMSIGAANTFGPPPYEENLVKYATPRCFNGVQFHDRIATAAGLPRIAPYKDVDADFTHGVNFAVAGSTTLPYEVLMAKHKIYQGKTTSLSKQLDEMSNYFHTICSNEKDCVEKFHRALFMIEEVGGNDYSYATFQGKNVEELKRMVPDVVNVIINSVKKVIDFGATRVIVPGLYPIGCLPTHQAAFISNNAEAYDENRCLKKFNDFAKYHNEQVQQAIYKLNQERPNAIIVYGDYYNAYQFLLRFAKYTYGSPVLCEDPDPNYVSWNPVHLNKQGHEIMADWLLHDVFDKLQCHS